MTTLQSPRLASGPDHLRPELLLLLLGHGDVTVREGSTFTAETAHGFLVGLVQKTKVLVLEELGLLLGRRVEAGSIRVEGVGVGRELLERGPGG